MAFTEKIKNLLIPQKSQKVGQPAYGTDCRAIEVWAQQAAKVVDDLIVYVNDLTPPTGYKSLTGPGETTTPGDLTQAGGFFVNDTLGHNIILQSTTEAVLQAGPTSGTHSDVQVFPTVVALSGGTISAEGSSITLTVIGSSHSLVLSISGAATPVLTIGAGSGTETFTADHGSVGFFGSTSVQQSSVGVTTVAQLVTILQGYGLLS